MAAAGRKAADKRIVKKWPLLVDSYIRKTAESVS